MSPPSRRASWILLFTLLSGALVAHAGDLLMIRSAERFPEAMMTLQNAIRAHGYTLSRVQRVDLGLTRSGYKTDKYRVVFFGKAGEIHRITARHPELISYLPLKLAIFAEGDQTLVVGANPGRFSRFFPAPDLQGIFKRWEHDYRAILEDVRHAE